MVGSPTETVDRGNWVVLVDGDVTLPTGTIPSEVAQAKLGYPATRKENLYWTYIHDLSYILYLICIYIYLYIYTWECSSALKSVLDFTTFKKTKNPNEMGEITTSCVDQSHFFGSIPKWILFVLLGHQDLSLGFRVALWSTSIANWKIGDLLRWFTMVYLYKIVIFHFAMLVYQRVIQWLPVFPNGWSCCDKSGGKKKERWDPGETLI